MNQKDLKKINKARTDLITKEYENILAIIARIETLNVEMHRNALKRSFLELAQLRSIGEITND